MDGPSVQETIDQEFWLTGVEGSLWSITFVSISVHVNFILCIRVQSRDLVPESESIKRQHMNGTSDGNISTTLTY